MHTVVYVYRHIIIFTWSLSDTRGENKTNKNCARAYSNTFVHTHCHTHCHTRTMLFKIHCIVKDPDWVPTFCVPSYVEQTCRTECLWPAVLISLCGPLSEGARAASTTRPGFDWFTHAVTSTMVMMQSFMSSDIGWHIRDKLWPMPKHGSMLLYVHRNRKAH